MTTTCTTLLHTLQVRAATTLLHIPMAVWGTLQGANTATATSTTSHHYMATPLAMINSIQHIQGSRSSTPVAPGEGTGSAVEAEAPRSRPVFLEE